VTLAETGPDSMTGGRVKRVEKYITEDTFMVTYGDGVADIDIGALLDFHKSHGKLATVSTVRPISRYGILDVDNQGKVLEFTEKPQIDGWASAGWLVLHRSIFDHLDGDDCVLEQEPLQRLAGEGQLMAYRHSGFFFAMDTYREYKYLNELWDNGQAPWRVWE
jgi:glucose-1-phosphate cytidylyltransferase